MGGTPFEVIPALDLSGGKLARMEGGRREGLRALAGDPLVVAERLVGAGARWLHVVDLDAALTGVPANLDLLERISRLSVRVEAGGGLSPEGVRACLERGAARAVLGAAWLSDPAAIARAVAEHGAALAVALDVRAGTVAPRGSGRAGPATADVLPGLLGLRPSLIVYTDVERDGTMAGPDLGALSSLAALAAPYGTGVLASGGVRSLEDLDALARIRPRLAGAIVGRALHQGAFSLEEALAGIT